VWELDQNGLKLREMFVGQTPEQVRVNTPGLIPCLKVLQNDDILLVAYLDAGLPSIIKLNRQGIVVFKKPLFTSKRDGAKFYRIILTHDGHLFVVGEKRSRAALLKLDPDGNVVLEKTYRFSRTGNLCFDGLRLNDAEYILSGLSWDSCPDPQLPQVWMVKIDVNGQVLKELTFPISRGIHFPGYQVAKLPSGNVAVVYPMQVEEMHSCRIKVLSKDLAEVFDKEVCQSGSFWMGSYSMEEVPNGVVVVGRTGLSAGSFYLLDERIQVVAQKTFDMSNGNAIQVRLSVRNNKVSVVTRACDTNDRSIDQVRMTVFDLPTGR